MDVGAGKEKRMNRLLIFGLAFFIAGGVPVYAASENPFGFETRTQPLDYKYCQAKPEEGE